MKLTTGLLYGLATTCQLCLASSKAYVYTIGQSSQQQPSLQPPTISASTARLLFAERLGLSHYHSIEQADDDTIDFLNHFGGSHEQIFIDENERKADQKVLVFVENVERPEDVLGAQSGYPLFFIEDPPSSSQNLQLVLDLLDQDRHQRSKFGRSCLFEFGKNSRKWLRGGINSEMNEPEECSKNKYFGAMSLDSPIDALRFMGDTGIILGSTFVMHFPFLEVIREQEVGSYKQVTEALKKWLSYLRLNNISSTIVLMPHKPKNIERPSTSPYGTYNVPSILQRRGQVFEEPLIAPAVTPPSSENPHSPTAQTFKTSVPRKGVLPLCQPSQEKCISATNNCSGHGIPYRKPGDPSAPSAKECWTCKCDNTVRRDKDGKVIKTTQWGGPSCQKKDVSVPFFLLAGLTLALVAIVGWGIGLLYSIGQEDLPSVIGAGVTGPRAQK